MLPATKPSARNNPDPNSRQKFYQLCVLVAAGCLTTMTGGVVSPILPEMMQQLSLDRQWAGTLVSIHALAIALFTPLLGILADRIGKLRVLLPSLMLYAVFGIAGAFVPTLPPLLATRVLLGITSAGIAAASIGLLGTMYEGEARSRILGYATSAMTTASILIPIVGGWVGSFHWRFAFFLYGLSLPTALVAVLLLRENRSRPSSLIPAGQNKILFQTIRKPEVLKLYLTIMLAAAIVYAVVIYTPIYLKMVMGAGPALNGFVLGIRAIGAAVVSAVLASRLAKRLGTNQTIALGFTVMALMLMTIPFLDELRWILPTAVLFGMGFGMAIPNIYNALAILAPVDVRSSVLAIGTGANSLGQFISPLILGPVWDAIGLAAVFFGASGVALIVGLLVFFQRELES
ncbi:MAG: MFS transporter [Elainellaceae cyanobacterium]